MITGHVLNQRVVQFPNIEEHRSFQFDFVIFSICAKPERYTELLKNILPGDTLRGLSYLSLSLSDTLQVTQWYALPLVRDTLLVSGWRLTESNYSEGIYGSKFIGSCPGSRNYIYGEYGVVEQKTSHKGRWGYTTFTTLDGTLREQWKYNYRENKRWVEVRTEYSVDGALMNKVRIHNSYARHGVRSVHWTLRDRGKQTLRRQKVMIND